MASNIKKSQRKRAISFSSDVRLITVSLFFTRVSYERSKPLKKWTPHGRDGIRSTRCDSEPWCAHKMERVIERISSVANPDAERPDLSSPGICRTKNCANNVKSSTDRYFSVTYER
ncbi:unnamed protein product [Clavelina lepadiformis]|uniref:Uncharacterized protein n=1 Tax=Clavelina lepadiformis TaxID=159417 RepID=A0ABP0FWU5_CLALP